MKDYKFFELLLKKGSINDVLIEHPDLTRKEIERFFADIIDFLKSREKANYELYVDGASSGNPGDAGIGFAVKKNGKIVKMNSRYIGKTTNNVAEYTALLDGLKYLLDNGVKEVKVYSDSELVVKQVNGLYRVKNDKLRELNRKVRELRDKFDVCDIIYISRENNHIADSLAKKGSKQKL